MTFGEGGLSLFFTLTAFLSIIAAAKAEDTPFAFHAYLDLEGAAWRAIMDDDAPVHRGGTPRLRSVQTGLPEADLTAVNVDD
jgi:hypothetical protein